MKNKIVVIILILFALAYKDTINAQNYGLAARVSTRGFGADVMRSFGDQFNLRAGIAFFNISPNGGSENDDYKYTADVKLLSAVLLGDYFPFDNSIRVTFGAILNLNQSDINLIPTQSYTVGGDTYDPESLGILSANVEFNKIAPYIGLGLGNPLKGENHLQFAFDIGTMYQGAAAVDLTATGLLAPSAAPDQEAQLEQNLSWFKWYPVLSFAVIYKF